VQVNEKWSFVGKKQKHCDGDGPQVASRADTPRPDDHQGDCWNHVALDRESKLTVGACDDSQMLSSVGTASGGLNAADKASKTMAA